MASQAMPTCRRLWGAGAAASAIRGGGALGAGAAADALGAIASEPRLNPRPAANPRGRVDQRILRILAQTAAGADLPESSAPCEWHPQHLHALSALAVFEMNSSNVNPRPSTTTFLPATAR